MAKTSLIILSVLSAVSTKHYDEGASEYGYTSSYDLSQEYSQHAYYPKLDSSSDVHN